jgi:hypothetical protein
MRSGVAGSRAFRDPGSGRRIVCEAQVMQNVNLLMDPELIEAVSQVGRVYGLSRPNLGRAAVRQIYLPGTGESTLRPADRRSVTLRGGEYE